MNRLAIALSMIMLFSGTFTHTVPSLAQAVITPSSTTGPTQEALLFVKESKTATPTAGVDIKHYDLYVAKGKEINLVAPNVYQNSYLSPDGRMVANYAFEGQLQVLVLDAKLNVTKTMSFRIPDTFKPDSRREITYLEWSPDSTRIALYNNCSGYLLTLATGEFTEIFYEYVNAYLCGVKNMAWSPSGSHLAFDTLDRAGLPQLYPDLHGQRPSRLVVISADGTGKRTLDEHGGYPVWSPDGRQILYTGGWRRDTDGDVYSNEKLYVMNADGSGKTLLAETTGKSDDSWTRPYYAVLGWSSDGKWVFFTQGRPGQGGQLTVVRPDGTGKVTIGGSESYGVMYLPRDNRIAWMEQFFDNRRREIILMSNLDGTNKVTLDEGEDLSEFTPCGNKVMWRKGPMWIAASPDGSNKSSFRRPEYRYTPNSLFSPNCSLVTYEDPANGVDQVFITDLLKGENLQVTKAQSGERFEILGWVNVGR